MNKIIRIPNNNVRISGWVIKKNSFFFKETIRLVASDTNIKHLSKKLHKVRLNLTDRDNGLDVRIDTE